MSVLLFKVGCGLLTIRGDQKQKITGVLQIGNVDLMLEGIEGGQGVRVNRRNSSL